jgi:hypothetical protein
VLWISPSTRQVAKIYEDKVVADLVDDDNGAQPRAGSAAIPSHHS